MRFKFTSLLFFLLCLLHSFSLQGQIIINEVLSSNSSGFVDEDGDFTDWIEIYNAGTTAVDLEAYALSDDENNLMKWIFPAVQIEAKGFLLVFASGKDRKLAGQNLHTNFKIKAEGEALFLLHPNGNILDQIAPVLLGPNQSYGAYPDGDSFFKFFDFPTPGKSNINSTEINFSKERGFYTEAFNLSISAALAGVDIYYTLDGSLPNVNSLSYTQSFLLKDRSSEENTISNIPTTHGKPEDVDRFHHWLWQAPEEKIAKANIVRAQAYLGNQAVSKVYSNSYFIFDQGANRYHYPVISIITEADNLFDEEKGIYVPGILHDPSNPEWTGNYFQKGSASERAVHIEYFEEDGRIGFYQNAGARIHGGNTRDAAQKSFRMYARKAYDKAYFNYPLFPQRTDQDQFEKFIIRSSITCWNNTIFKDALSHQIVKDLNIDIQNYRPVILFINGAYWGIQTLRELNDERYLGLLHDLDKDSIEVIDSWNSAGNTEYHAFKEFYSNEDLSLAVNYAHVEQTINLDNYIDYQIAEIYFANLDWPGNNLERWKYQSPGSKWNWLFYDLDGGYFDPSMNTLEYARDENSSHWANPEPTTRLFRKLMENENFQNRFANRFADLLHTSFHPDRVLPIIDEFTNQYAPEIDEHIQRWHFPESKTKWLNDISSVLKYFVANRTCHLQEYLLQATGIAPFSPQCYDDSAKVSGMKIYPNPSDGFSKIEIYSEGTSSQILEVYNSLGQKLRQFLLTTNSVEYLDLSNYPAGIYYLKLVEENAAQKLIIY